MIIKSGRVRKEGFVDVLPTSSLIADCSVG